MSQSLLLLCTLLALNAQTRNIAVSHSASGGVAVQQRACLCFTQAKVDNSDRTISYLPTTIIACHFLTPTTNCHDPMQLPHTLCAPCGHSRPRRPEPLFYAPCTCGCRLPLLKTASQPRHDMATTPPGVGILTPRRIHPQDPAASRLRRNTEDPARPPPLRPPHAAVHIYPIAHTWSLPLATRSTGSPCASPPTA